MNDLAYLLITAFAVYRVWQAIANDILTEKPREWVFDRTPEWFAVMVTCPWCLGFWLSGLGTLVLTSILEHSHLPWWLTWLALSALVGLMNERSK